MGIPDPVMNCVLSVCCPPAVAQEGFATLLVREGLSEADAKTCAAWVFEYFDLAPKGTLVELKAAIAKLARDTRAPE
jgi:hypothetical protein